MVSNVLGKEENSQSSAVEEKVRRDENVVEELYPNCGESVRYGRPPTGVPTHTLNAVLCPARDLPQHDLPLEGAEHDQTELDYAHVRYRSRRYRRQERAYR